MREDNEEPNTGYARQRQSNMAWRRCRCPILSDQRTLHGNNAIQTNFCKHGKTQMPPRVTLKRTLCKGLDASLLDWQSRIFVHTCSLAHTYLTTTNKFKHRCKPALPKKKQSLQHVFRILHLLFMVICICRSDCHSIPKFVPTPIILVLVFISLGFYLQLEMRLSLAAAFTEA